MNDRIGYAKGIGHFVMAADTDDEHCGSCQWGGVSASEVPEPYCFAFRQPVNGRDRSDVCKGAEVK